MDRSKVMGAMARGRRALDRGDVHGAIRCFDRALAMDPDCAQGLLYRAGLKLLAGDMDGAVADFRGMETLDHGRLPAYRDLTTVSAEEFPRLIADSDAAVRRAPDAPWAHVFRGFSRRSLMRYDEAVGDLDRAVACAPRSAALLAMRSRVKLTNRQDFYDGVKDMEAAVRLAPDWGWLSCWLGEALRHRKDYAGALRALDRGLRLDPAYLRGYAWRGGVLVAMGRHRRAIGDLTRSLAWDPVYSYDFEYTADQKSWAYNQRAHAHRALGAWREALHDMDQAHRFGPRYLWVYDPQGRPEAVEAGLRDLDRALAAFPRSASALAWKGRTLLQAGRLQEALPPLKAAVRLAPRRAFPRAWLAQALLASGDLPGAERSASAALRLDRAYAPAWGTRARARRAAGRTAEAAADFAAAYKADHRASWAFAGQGECLRLLGDLEGSRKALDRALAIHPEYPEARAWRAETLRLAGDLEGAAADAEAALASGPRVDALLTRSLVRQARRDFDGQIRDFKEAARLDPRLGEFLPA